MAWRTRLRILVLTLAVALPAAAERVPITLLQINDVYEISPVQGGREGGIARLATLRRELQRKNPRTFLLLAGDAFSPSALGTAEVDGGRIDGAQMVAALNAAGLDYATFGNHEFDIPEAHFLARIRESHAVWFSGNCRDREGQPFPGVPESVIFTVRGAQGAAVRIGLIGVTIDSTKAAWVRYLDPLETARQQAQALRPKVDILIAVTHLALQDDQKLAETVPEIDLILGGHEHENWRLYRGAHFTPILKADANARSAYVHELVYDTQAKTLQIRSTLRRITPEIAEEPATAAVVRGWTEKAFRAFRARGFEPEATVAQAPIALDGAESRVRNGSTALTGLIAQAMLREWPEADAAVFNAGSIRIDDEIPPGPVTQYDILRILPFGGKVLGVEIKGGLLARVLEAGRANRGSGGFLQLANIAPSADGAAWMVSGKPLDPQKSYRIAISDYLLTGKEQGLDFLTRTAEGVGAVREFRDIRFALIEEMKARWKAASAADRRPYPHHFSAIADNAEL